MHALTAPPTAQVPDESPTGGPDADHALHRSYEGVVLDAAVLGRWPSADRESALDLLRTLSGLGVPVGVLAHPGADREPVPGVPIVPTITGFLRTHRLGRGEVYLPGPGAASAPRVLACLADQVQRRRDGRVPTVDPDPRWTIPLPSETDQQRRSADSLATLGAAGFGTRGCVEEDGPGTQPLVLADGIYRSGQDGMVPGPVWTTIGIEPPVSQDRRLLDLR